MRPWPHRIGITRFDPKLGIDFKQELDRAVVRISTAPERWPQHQHGTQCVLLERFPYLIVYLHEETQIQIIAVQHTETPTGILAGTP